MDNVLATRYASRPMVEIWSPEARVVLERQLWVTVLEAQRDLGIEVDDSVIADYRAVIDQIDLASIRAREETTRHDVKARLEEFCALAGHEQVHKGMTSRDLTENVEQLQIRHSLEVILDRMVASLARLARLAAEYSPLVIAGRTHNVVAQPTTLGKRFVTAAEELLVAHRRVADLEEHYPLRGLKGPVGTQQDQLDLFDGDAGKVEHLERLVAESLLVAVPNTASTQIENHHPDIALNIQVAQSKADMGQVIDAVVIGSKWIGADLDVLDGPRLVELQDQSAFGLHISCFRLELLVPD